ncbi:MAG: aminoacyl-histidine dipeptidase [Lentisphaerota bacterium]
MNNLKGAENIKPVLLWKNFDRILGFPHPSKHEQKLADFIFNFGKELGLETERDAVGNVVIRKSASKVELTRKDMVTLQSHIDMVPQKADGKDFDFAKDTIKAFVDGEFVKADGTTLGADNGIGVAAIMALLEAKDIEHGPIEGFFTIDEEAGMTGVKNLQPGFLKGKYLLNLDSEEEGQIFIGCAGGIDTTAIFNYKNVPVPNGFNAYKLTILGLKGGHSGCNIHEGRGNAIKMLARVLYEAKAVADLSLCEITGGTLRNVIPSKASAILIVSSKDDKAFKDKVNDLSLAIKKEYKFAAPNMTLTLEQEKLPSFALDQKVSLNLINAVHGCIDGVIRMDDNLPIVETSSNMGIIKTTESEILIKCLQRSSIDTARNLTSTMIESVFKLAGAEKIIIDGAYTGWKPNVSSPLLQVVKDTHKELFNYDALVTAIHAGLECGLIGAVYPQMDMISFGPTIKDAHSINERVEIKSVEKFFDFVCLVLKNIK